MTVTAVPPASWRFLAFFAVAVGTRMVVVVVVVLERVGDWR